MNTLRTRLSSRLSSTSFLESTRTTTSTICASCLRRSFSTTPTALSKIGGAPLVIPSSVKISVYTPPPPPRPTRNIQPSTCTVEGPLGQITIPIPPFLTITHKPAPEGAVVTSTKAMVTVQDPTIKAQRQMWGTIRALLANHIIGVTEGHAAMVRFVGVGYRAIIEDGNGRFTKGKKVVNLKLGYSHPILLPVPEGITASAPVPVRLLLEGINKQAVNLFAAEIRRWRVPEPYKGKGLFVNDEKIKLKAKKIK